MSAQKDQINIQREVAVYNALHDVFTEGMFSTMAINRVLNENEKDAPYITKLFYGVLDKSIQFDYIIETLTKKRPKKSIQIIIKMGLYMIRYMNLPSYAAVDRTLLLCKRLGKTGVSGFVNVILRKSIEFNLPQKEEVDISTYYSVIYSYPKWAVNRLLKQYGSDFSEDFLSAEIPQYTHIRANLTKILQDDFDKEMETIGYEQKTKYGYYVTRNMLHNIKKSDYIIQSFPSVIAVNSLISNIEISSVLDLCAAPGGKSVLLKQLTNASVTACDLFPHRVNLIEQYAKNTGINDIKVCVYDATGDLKLEWMDKFDFVLCDVPCSNFGVVNAKPDIFLNKTEKDIESLKKIQYDILNNAAHYVKAGKYLAYSTCTIFKDENENIIEKFLSEHKNFVIDKIENEYSQNGFVKLFAQKDKCGAFFAARLRRLS